MRRECLAGVAMGLSMLLCPCSQVSIKTADEQAIRDAELALARDWKSKDLERILSHFVDTSSLLLLDSWPVEGKDALRAALTEFLADKDLLLTLTPSDETTGNILRERTYVLTRNNSRSMASITKKAVYMILFGKLAKGRWAVEHQSYWPSAPAKPRPASTRGSRQSLLP
jgi:ketosteroid isomerase-like protein